MPRSWSKPQKNCAKHPRKDKRGRWCACDGPGWRYRMSYPDPTTGIPGKPRWSTTFRIAEDADRDQRKTRQEIADGTYASDRGKTVEEFLLEWLASRRSRGFGPNGLADLESKINAHLIPHLGYLRLGALRPHHIQTMLDTIAVTPSTHGRSKGKPVEAVTINGIRTVLKTALAEAVDLQLITANWADRVKPHQVKKRKPIDIGRQRSARFLQHVATDRLAAMWLLYVLYPTRRAEILGLRWDDLSRKARRLQIVQTLTDPTGIWDCPFCGGAHSRLHFGPPKTEAGRRPIPLIDVIDAALTLHREAQDAEKATYATDYVDHGLLFCEPSGQPLAPEKVSRAFKRHMQDAGLIAPGEAISLKSLRSSAVTALHEDGLDLEVITAVAGHRPDGQVTRDHYLRVRGERARGPFEALATILLQGPTQVGT